MRWTQRLQTIWSTGDSGDAVRPAFPSLGHRLAHRPQNSRFADAPFAADTLASLIQLEAMPRWVRVIHVNDLPEPRSIDAAAVSLTSAVGDGLTPLDDAHKPSPELWRQLSYAAGGADSDPLAAEHDGSRTVEISGNPREPGRPTMIFSDWLSISGPERDNGRGALLLVRSYSRGHVRHAGSVGQPDRRIGLAHAGYRIPGNAAAPPFYCDGAERNDRLFACHGVQIITETLGATVLGIGDSIIHSSCTSGEMSGFGIRACAMLSTAGRPVSYVNEGYPGRNSAGFAWCGDWAIRNLRPQVALIQTWSQNEPWTRDMAELSFARAVALADLARRHGGVPVLCTAAPVFADCPEAEVHRRHNIARVRALAAQGMPLLDLDALWGTGGNPNAYRPEFSAGDGMHPNDNGCHAAALVLAPQLRRILGG
jgi:hypothetical protein